MKSIATKILLFVCVVCIVLGGGVAIYAADTTPKIAITLDNTKKNAKIKLENVGIMIYSAQITLKVSDLTADYTLTPENQNAYSKVRKDTENNTLVLYIDSTELMDGSKEISLATLVSDKEMSISNRAELILIDRSMVSAPYNNVVVNVSAESSNTNNPSRNPGGASSGNHGGITGVVTVPVTPPSSTQGTIGGFTDVADNHWAKGSIAYVTVKGLFNGMTETTFAPDTEMTRAMYVVVLSRFGTKIDAKWQIPCDSPKQFDDIAAGEWYADAVAWAGGTGLVNGMGNNMFEPARPITREQLAVMTVNFAKLCGAELPSNVEAVTFSDNDKIQSYAADAVRAAQQAGLINGRTDGTFAPQDTATRAEVAAILHRFVTLVK
ncbi:MAG: S-layer homology domain-containing protein [Clostridia bacterium]|nr:S-layer homology domain-containing protein [Clostridia bacterium]